MSDWRDGVERGRPVHVRRWHLAWLIGSAVLWAAIIGIIIAMVMGWP